MAFDLMYGQISPQRTLKSPVQCSGVALHKGVRVDMTLQPVDVNTGIIFIRTDVADNRGVIPATWEHVLDMPLCTMIANGHGVSVSTIEHLMAAFRGCGIDNAIVELHGPELPAMDGSAAPFVEMIEAAGTMPQAAAKRAIRVLKPIEVGDSTRGVSLTPGRGASFSFEIDFPSRAVRHQEGFIRLANGAFKADLAPARTFGFLAEVEHLRAHGLARGGSLDNAIVVDDDCILNEGGLRYEDEFVRHKLLDSVGDLYLAGAPIIGHFHGRRSGHTLNHMLLRALFADDTAWCFDTLGIPEYASPGWVPGGLAQTA